MGELHMWGFIKIIIIIVLCVCFTPIAGLIAAWIFNGFNNDRSAYGNVADVFDDAFDKKKKKQG